MRVSPLMVRGCIIVTSGFAAAFFLATLHVSIFLQMAQHSLASMQTLTSWGTFSSAGLLICIGVGIYQVRGWKEAVLLEQERHILDFVKSHDGPVMLGDVVLNCPLRASAAGKSLDRLIAAGVCESTIDERGKLLYSFSSTRRPMIESRSKHDQRSES